MALHLPALGKLKAFLSTPKGKKTALLGVGGVGAVVLGLRAKKNGALTTTQTGQTDPAQALDASTPPTAGGGFTFPDFPSSLVPFPGDGTAGGTQGGGSSGVSTGFDPGSGGGGQSRSFAGPAPVTFSDEISLPGGAPSGPAVGGVGAVIGKGLLSSPRTVGSVIGGNLKTSTPSTPVAVGGAGKVGSWIAAPAPRSVGSVIAAPPKSVGSVIAAPAPKKTVGGVIGAPAPKKTVGGVIGGPAPKSKVIHGF